MKKSYVPVKVDGLDELIKLLDQASQQAKQLDKTLKKIQKQKLTFLTGNRAKAKLKQ